MARTTLMTRGERRRELGSYVKSNWELYLMLLIPIAFVLIFKYAAYPGLRIAFMNYKPAKGYAGSAWVGMENFQKIFKDKDFLRALKNSLAFNFLDLLVGFPVPIILALLLNELRFDRYKKVSQTVLYLPHGGHRQGHTVPDRKVALGGDLPADRRMAEHGLGLHHLSGGHHRHQPGPL